MLFSYHPSNTRQVSPVLVLQVVDPVAAAQPAARSKDLMRAMKEAAQGMRGGREVRFLPTAVPGPFSCCDGAQCCDRACHLGSFLKAVVIVLVYSAAVTVTQCHSSAVMTSPLWLCQLCR